MMPVNSQSMNAYEKNSASAHQASSNMNASNFNKNLSYAKSIVNQDLILDWYAMAQMAAQDYFSRLQMSGMVHPDMANFAALGGLNAMHISPSTASSSPVNKHNLKRKDKSSNQDEMNKSSVSKEVKNVK